MQKTAQTDYWLAQCRRHMATQGYSIKVAELGGDGQDAPFEQSFSNLAHAYLRDKAPSLLDHELGFQLIDRNQENTKAVGVLAFKVGSQQLFAPVFFLQGDLKGHELLYLKAQDMFVPLKENWLNYILNRKPNILGTGVSRQTSQMGVMQPDLNRLSQSPYKYASARDFMPLVGHLATTSWSAALNDYEEHCQERLDLGHFMKQASLPALEACVDMMKRKPKVAAAFDRWHGMGLLHDSIKEARVRMEQHSILDNPYVAVNRNQLRTGSILNEKTAADGDKGVLVHQKVKIVVFDSAMVDGPPEDVNEEDAEKLLEDGVLIEDHRDGDEVSVAVNMQVEQRLTNPTETGIYQVLTKPGDFEKCLVITQPHGPNGRKPHCTVIRLDEGTRNWGNFPRDDVWVAGQDEELGGEEKWMEWFDKQSDASLSEDSDSRYVIIGPRRNATFPFKVKHSIGEDSYEVDFSCDCDYGRHLSKGLHRYHAHDDWGFDEYSPWRDGQRIHMDSKIGTDLRSNHGDVYIPKGCKILKVEPTRADKERAKSKDGDMPVACHFGDDQQSDPPPIQPGKLLDATMQIMKKTASLKVAADELGYSINGSRVVREIPALVHLVRDHGLREDIGRHILKEARANFRGLRAPFECRVKYANPYLTGQGPSAPAIPEPEMGGYNPMGFQGNVQEGYAQEMVVPELQASNTDPSIYNVNPANMPEPMDANGVQQAAATGQKEVFDTAMIGSMLKAVRDDTMIDRYLPDLVKGMDRLGRILFMFYWHQDQFAERYGKQDLPELEDSLRNAFEMMGDVILFLKQKTIEPYPEEDVRDLDLGAAANI